MYSHFGSIWDLLGFSLAFIGEPLAPIGVILASHWPSFGVPWAPFASLWGALWVLIGHPGTPWAVLGRPLDLTANPTPKCVEPTAKYTKT